MRIVACDTRLFTLLLFVFLTASVTTLSQTPAEADTKKPVAIKFAELGPMSRANFVKGFRPFFVELSNKPGHQGYIINYGSDQEIARRERLITNEVAFRKYDRSRITLVHGGPRSKPLTELWVIPPGADNPPVSGGEKGSGSPSLSVENELFALQRSPGSR